MNITPADIERWKANGHTDEEIARWVRNAQKAARERNTLAYHMAQLANRIQGRAPGTPPDADPIVIDVPARTSCSHCGDLRVILSVGGNVMPCPHCGADRDAAERRARSLDKYSSASGRAQAQTFDALDVHHHPSLATCRDAALVWADGPQGWLIVWGQPGNGKSHLCAAVYNHLRAAGQPTIFITGPELIRSLKALMDAEVAEAEGETVAQRLEKYQRAPVLILDDLRAEQLTAWVDATWFDLLDFRYRNRLPTMIATNSDPAGPDFPARISSRLRDEHDGFSVVLRNDAPDYRTGGAR